MQGTARLRRIAEEEPDEGFLPTEQQADPMAEAQRKAAGIALRMALAALAQKTVVALASIYSLLLAGSVFAVVMTILPEPSVHQLVGAGGYGVFVLVLHLVRKR